MSEAARKWHRDAGRAGAEVGSLWPVADPERKRYCRGDAHAFLTTYFPATSGLSPFCQEQRDAIARIQGAILHGGRVLNLFPRGFAKTTTSENLALWATMYGHARFIPIIGADENAAKDNIESIKTELYTNDLLAEDFPEIIAAVKHLEQKAQGARSQTYNGEATHIQWGQDCVVLPSIRDDKGQWYPSSGAILLARGLTGRIRGMKHKRPDGVQQRPDFVIIDDPQTGQSARSPAQCTKRLSFIRKDVLRLGGHNRQIAAAINATVIEQDDAIDQLADHNQHPEWEGLKIPMLKSDSRVHDTLWMDEYATIRKTYDPEKIGDRKRAVEASNAFYRAHRDEMDAGAVATWEHCYTDCELSAIQHAYNIRIDDGEDVFASECQNSPIRIGDNSEFLTAGEIVGNRVGSWVDFPAEVNCLGFHIDVQKRLLFWTVVGITPDFRIHPVYGTYPEQKATNLEYRSIKTSIQRIHRGMSEEKSIQAALEVLLADLTQRKWKRQDGVEIACDMGLVDGGYQTGSVRAAIANAAGGRVFPLFGKGLKAADVPLLQRQKQKSEVRSNDPAIPWILRPDRTDPRLRNVFDDTNSLKTFLHRRIATDAGRGGSFELPKGEHRRYAEHLASSEYPTETSGPHGLCTEWRQLPGNPDNHWLDTTCGAIVACSMTGKVGFNQVTAPKLKKRKRVAYL